VLNLSTNINITFKESAFPHFAPCKDFNTLWSHHKVQHLLGEPNEDVKLCQIACPTPCLLPSWIRPIQPACRSILVRGKPPTIRSQGRSQQTRISSTGRCHRSIASRRFWRGWCGRYGPAYLQPCDYRWACWTDERINTLTIHMKFEKNKEKSYFFKLNYWHSI